METVPQEAAEQTPSRKSGSLWWFSEILDDQTLTPTDTLLMLALADHVDADDRCWPRIEHLAHRARCSYSTAKRRLAALEEEGRIVRERQRRSDGNMGVYVYQLVRNRPGLKMSPGECDQGSPRWSLTRAHPDEPAEVTISEVTIFTNDLPAPQRVLTPVHRFDEFWEVFPLKKGKGAAQRAWVKAVKKTDPSVIIEGARRYAEDPKRDPAYTKYPQGWLNDERWGDAAQASVVKPTNGKVFLPGSGWIGSV